MHRASCRTISLLIAILVGPSALAGNRELQPSKFLRFVADDSGGGELQTSIVTYRNRDGVTVDLVGAVHIADPAYFSALNDRFDSYDAVLFEMVRPRDSLPRSSVTRGAQRLPEDRSATTAPMRGRRSLGWIGTMQRFLRDHLELEFQLEAIDYDKPNFVHADLDVETFLAMQEQRGESMMRLMLQAMLREMAKGPKAAANQPNMYQLLAALQAPDRARQLKLILAKQFAHMDELLASLEGPKGSVILSERNKAAMKVVAERIAQGDDKLAVFYGAGHLKGMEKILVEEMGFEQSGEPKWLVAWDMTTTTAPAAPATAPAGAR